MNYYIFRHSETYFSKNDAHYGSLNETAEIIPEGVAATERLAKYLATKNINAFYSSPFKRCVQTAEIVEKITGKKFLTDTRIGEEMINYGKETFDELVDRIKKFLDEIKTKKYQGIAICSHGWPIASLVAQITKGEVSQNDLKSYPACGILIEIENGVTTKKDFN